MAENEQEGDRVWQRTNRRETGCGRERTGGRQGVAENEQEVDRVC